MANYLGGWVIDLAIQLKRLLSLEFFPILHLFPMNLTF